MNLQSIINNLNFDYVDSDITEENFPPQEVSRDWEVKQFDTVKTIAEVEIYAKEHSMRLANLYELLAYAKEEWNGKGIVIAGGSSTVIEGEPFIPYLGGFRGWRGLFLGFADYGWDPEGRFLLVKIQEPEVEYPGKFEQDGRGKNKYRHGMEGTRIYHIWDNMRRRVKKTDKNRKYYLDKGIIVCEEWNDAKNFMDDMLPSYLEHVEQFGVKNTQLDRIDNSKGYSPENCRWVTIREQNLNRGKKVTIVIENL